MKVINATEIFSYFIKKNIAHRARFIGRCAELRRLSDRESGQVVADYRDINLAQGAGLELALASRDHLTVRDIPDWSPTDAIIVQGEVKFPGEYRIRESILENPFATIFILWVVPEVKITSCGLAIPK